jgi:hypothetical protein
VPTDWARPMNGFAIPVRGWQRNFSAARSHADMLALKALRRLDTASRNPLTPRPVRGAKSVAGFC